MPTYGLQQTHDARVADIVRPGCLRVALFLPQYTTDPVTGELSATPVFRDIARALADRIGVETVLMGYQNPREVVECLKPNACDVAFMVPDKSRVDEIGFSHPVIESDLTCLVPVDSSICCMADADRAGVSIVAVRNHASTLALSRILKQAVVVTAETPDAAFALLRSGYSNAMASARSVLLEYSAKLPEARVLRDRYGFQLLAMAVPKDKTEWLTYVCEFVEEAKASGFVQRIIERAGRTGLQVAPLTNPTVKKLNFEEAFNLHYHSSKHAQNTRLSIALMAIEPCLNPTLL